MRVGFSNTIAFWRIIAITGSDFVGWDYSPQLAFTSAVNMIRVSDLVAELIDCVPKKTR